MISMLYILMAVSASCSWSAPTTGTPVEHYVVAHSVNGGAWGIIGTTPDTTYTLEIDFEADHRVRVAGVDAQDRQGPYSEPSNTYSPYKRDLSEEPGTPWRIR